MSIGTPRLLKPCLGSAGPNLVEAGLNVVTVPADLREGIRALYIIPSHVLVHWTPLPVIVISNAVSLSLVLVLNLIIVIFMLVFLCDLLVVIDVIVITIIMVISTVILTIVGIVVLYFLFVLVVSLSFFCCSLSCVLFQLLVFYTPMYILCFLLIPVRDPRH